jgi:hypothetical protein
MKNLLKLDETYVVDNAPESLRNESGVFEVTAPTGDKFRVVCRPGCPLTVSNAGCPPDAKRENLKWRIKKIGELPETRFKPDGRNTGLA